MKIAYWDIETTDLNAEFGRILVASILSLPDEKITTLRLDKYVKSGKASDMADDHALCVDLRNALEDFHITVGWYSKGFDMSYLNTRLVKHGEKPIRSHLHLDGIWYAKGWRGIKAAKGSLANMAKFFKLEESKLVVDEEVWSAAKLGNTDALDTIVERCESDVRLTRGVTEKLLGAGLIRNIQSYP